MVWENGRNKTDNCKGYVFVFLSCKAERLVVVFFALMVCNVSVVVLLFNKPSDGPWEGWVWLMIRIALT